MESALQIHLTKSYISERPQYMILSTELPHAKTGTDFGSFESKPSVLGYNGFDCHFDFEMAPYLPNSMHTAIIPNIHLHSKCSSL